MKKIFTLVTGLLAAVAVFGQIPQSFNYQAIARDGSGNVLANKPVGLQLTILDGSATGAVLYAETFSLTTNEFGLFTLGVGTGTVANGSFSGISWPIGSKYLKTELDPAGGTNYTLTGTTQLLSVPYALYASSAGTSSNSYWSVNGNNSIVNTNTGDVGINLGGSALLNTVQIGSPPGFGGNTLAMGNGTQGMSFGFAGATSTSTWFTNNNFALMPALGGDGFVGVGTTAPTNQLQIGSTPGFVGNNLAMGNGTQAMSFFQDVTTSKWFSNTSFSFLPAGGTGNVGIGVIPSTTVKLEIQPAAGTTGIYVTGSGTRTAFEAQTGDFLLDGGNASIVGNTTMSGDVTITSLDPTTAALTIGSGYFAGQPANTKSLTNCGGFCGNSPLAINASDGDIWASAFYAFSDERLKNVIGPSDPASDLELLNRIRITDYTMKDTRADGGRRFKKVIAQQVEKIYPQVIETGKGYIPNVYQSTSKMERTDDGYLLSFSKPHGISKTATKLRLAAKGSMKPYEILSIPSDRQVLIKAPVINSDAVFVYGEQVNDLHTVDYEGLSTLNISATQELSKLVRQQAQVIERLSNRISQLETSVKKGGSSLDRPQQGR
jgi:hypothetical protein